jgi:hypothetical protein
LAKRLPVPTASAPTTASTPNSGRCAGRTYAATSPSTPTSASAPKRRSASTAVCAPAVIYRKLSLGSRSQGGERTIERLLSVDQTCRLQRRSLYAYLADVLTAKARGEPVPSLA